MKFRPSREACYFSTKKSLTAREVLVLNTATSYFILNWFYLTADKQGSIHPDNTVIASSLRSVSKVPHNTEIALGLEPGFWKTLLSF